MSEQRRTISIVAAAPSKTFLQKLLDGVETVGNKVPHPAVIFFILSGLVIVLSHLFYLPGTSVDYEVVNPQTHKVEHATATVNSLLSGHGIRFMLTSMVRNFMNFGPVGVILVVMVGVGLAEQARSRYRSDRRQLALHEQPDRADHAGISGDRRGLWYRSRDNHQHGRWH
jgi:hypothetical protein